jgi:hypothetical protein
MVADIMGGPLTGLAYQRIFGRYTSESTQSDERITSFLPVLGGKQTYPENPGSAGIEITFPHLQLASSRKDTPRPFSE